MQRGEKVAISSGLAAQLGGDGHAYHRAGPQGAAVGGRRGRSGAWLACCRSSGSQGYRRFTLRNQRGCSRSELATIESAARKVLESDLRATDAEPEAGRAQGAVIERPATRPIRAR